MDYEREEEKFYELMKKKKDEIKASDISDEEKNESYLFIEEKLQKYVQFKITSLKKQILLANLNKLQKGLHKILENMMYKKKIINLDEFIKKQKASRKILPFPGDIPFSNN